MATKPRSNSIFSIPPVISVVFRSVQGQFLIGTGDFSDGVPSGFEFSGCGAEHGQQSEDDGVTLPDPFAAFCMASKQHQPCGSAKVRLQANTRVRRKVFLIRFESYSMVIADSRRASDKSLSAILAVQQNCSRRRLT
jgi:hypothetical protein